MPDNPHVLMNESRYRGYTRVEVTPERWVADLRIMETVKTPDSPCTTLATYVVENGKPIERNLRRNRITVEELAAAARQNAIGSISDVQWAVLETNGRISFIERS